MKIIQETFDLEKAYIVDREKTFSVFSKTFDPMIGFMSEEVASGFETEQEAEHWIEHKKNSGL